MFTKNYIHRNSACPQRKIPWMSWRLFFPFSHSFLFCFFFYFSFSFFEKHVKVRYRAEGSWCQCLGILLPCQPRALCGLSCPTVTGCWGEHWVKPPGSTMSLCCDLPREPLCRHPAESCSQQPPPRRSSGCPELELVPLCIFRLSVGLSPRHQTWHMLLVDSKQKIHPWEAAGWPCSVSWESWREKASDKETVSRGDNNLDTI